MLGINLGLVRSLMAGAGIPVSPAALFGPSFSVMSGAQPTNGELTADGFTWAQGSPMVIDNYGKIIVLSQWESGGSNTNSFVVSNDGGANWVYPTHTGMANSNGELYLTRGSCAYDNINDLVHVLWNAANPTDGLIYRRYSISRDGQNNITGFTRVSGVSFQLDYHEGGNVLYGHPILAFIESIGSDGGLLAMWSARNASAPSSKCEVRSSMRVLSNTSADGVAGNWKAPVTASSTSIAQSPQVPYSAVVTKPASTSACFPSIGIKSTGDVYVLFSDGDATEEWQWVKMQWDGANSDWRTGVTSPVKVSDFVRTGSDGGYTLKRELGSAWHEDTVTGRMYVAFATWNAGDTWSFVFLDANDELSGVVDAYAAPSAHCSSIDFVTGDIMFDSNTGRLVTAYTDLPAKHVYMRLFNGEVAQGDPLEAFSAQPFDIPTLYPDRVNGDIFLVGRDFNVESTNNPPVYSPRYRGYAGTVNLS